MNPRTQYEIERHQLQRGRVAFYETDRGASLLIAFLLLVTLFATVGADLIIAAQEMGNV